MDAGRYDPDPNTDGVQIGGIFFAKTPEAWERHRLWLVETFGYRVEKGLLYEHALVGVTTWLRLGTPAPIQCRTCKEELGEDRAEARKHQCDLPSGEGGNNELAEAPDVDRFVWVLKDQQYPADDSRFPLLPRVGINAAAAGEWALLEPSLTLLNYLLEIADTKLESLKIGEERRLARRRFLKFVKYLTSIDVGDRDDRAAVDFVIEVCTQAP